MEGLNLWVLQLCVCAVAVVIAENLMPEGNVKKTVYFVMGLIVLTCFISPINNFSFDEINLKSESELANENADWFNRTTDEMFKSNVASLVNDCLSEMGISPKSIELSTDINEDNCIYINKVRVTVTDEYATRIDEIVDTVYQKLGLDTDVVVR